LDEPKPVSEELKAEEVVETSVTEPAAEVEAETVVASESEGAVEPVQEETKTASAKSSGESKEEKENAS
jgi:hypothetical protein